MENILTFGAPSEVKTIYDRLGVPAVSSNSNGKAPSVQPLPASSTKTSVTAKFNVMSSADISALSYTVNDGAATSITPQKGIVTITLSDLEYNSGPYEIKLTATNEIGSTYTTSTVDLQRYTNWATTDEVLAGNKFIGEDGEEHVGEIVTKTATNVTFSNGNVNVPVGYYAEQVTKEYPVPVLETVPVTPTTSAQTITPSTDYDGIGQVNVSAVTSAIDANITAGNIKNGVTILGVTGTMSGGPTDGGAVISSVELVNDGGFECTVTFDTMPSLDTANHKYAVDLIAYCVEQSGVFADQTYHYNNMTSIPLNTCVIDSTLNTITFFDVNAPLDGAGNILSSTPGYILIYEDGYDNLKYKMSCTVTVTQP